MSWQSDFVSGTNLNSTKSTTASKNLSLNLAPYNNHQSKQLYNTNSGNSYAQQQAFQQQQQQQFQNYSNSISTSYNNKAPAGTGSNYANNNGYSNGTYVNSRLSTPPSLSHSSTNQRKTPTNIGPSQQQIYPLVYSPQQTNQYFNNNSPTTSVALQAPQPIQQTYYSSPPQQQHNSSNMGGSAQSNLQKNQPPAPQQQPSPSSQSNSQQQYPYTNNNSSYNNNSNAQGAYKNSSSSSSSMISNNYSNGQQYQMNGAMHQYLNHIPPGVQANSSSSSSQSPSSSRSPVLVNSIIDLVRKLNIKLIAFDFDLTLVNTHTGGQWIDSPEKLAEFVRPCFRELLPVLLKCPDLFVCIVTYSPQEELIREVLKISLKEEYGISELLNKMIIIGNTREFLEEHGVENCYSMGKQIHLDQCRKYYENILNNVYYGGSQPKLNNRIGNASILLIDDDVQNLKMAHSNGHLAFQVNNNMQLIDLYDFLNSQLRS